MTLKQWCKKYNAHCETVRGAMVVSQYDSNAELFHLSDYAVSSVIAGGIWLVRRAQGKNGEK